MKNIFIKKLVILLFAITNIFIFSACGKGGNTKGQDLKNNSTINVSEDAAGPPENTPSQESQQTSNTFLWKIEKKGQPDSYLLGTIHLGKTGVPLPKHVSENLKKTDALMTEVVLDDSTLSSPGMSESIMSMISLDPDNKLSDVLGKQKFDQVYATIGPRIGIAAPEQLEFFKPWAVAMMLSIYTPEGYSPEFGVDQLLNKEASSQGKKKLGLEQAAQQLKMFSDMPEDKVVSLINVSLDKANENAELTRKLLDLYENNQSEALNKLVFEQKDSFGGFPESEREYWLKWSTETMLSDRNLSWVAPLKAQLPLQSTFVAVGAAHLYGEKGVIELLKKEGYTLTPVSP